MCSVLHAPAGAAAPLLMLLMMMVVARHVSRPQKQSDFALLAFCLLPAFPPATASFPADPPKGKGNRIAEASGMVMSAPAHLPDISLK